MVTLDVVLYLNIRHEAPELSIEQAWGVAEQVYREYSHLPVSRVNTRDALSDSTRLARELVDAEEG